MLLHGHRQQLWQRLLGFFFTIARVVFRRLTRIFKHLANDCHLLRLETWTFVDLVQAQGHRNNFRLRFDWLKCPRGLRVCCLFLANTVHFVAVAGQGSRLVAV